MAVIPCAYPQEAPSAAAREEAALRAATDAVAPSVVQIRTIGGLDDGGPVSADGPTTGLVISPDGFIVASSFNFTQSPASILVTFAGGKQAPAELIATDYSRMLVLLKVDNVPDLPVPTLAPLDEIRVGQWAVAVGRTFRPDKINVSVGIVSALGRMYGKVLQTDADVSTANYGGPLVDIRGRVLGVIVPIAPQGAGEVAGVEWYDSGIGFAVPLGTIADAIERMKRGEDLRAGILGVGFAGKNAHSSPATLAVVRPDSPAGRAGLKKDDRIVEVDGRPIKSQTDFRFALGPRYGGDSIDIVALRGDERIKKTIKLAAELSAFRHAFLGVLSIRSTTPASPPENGDGHNEAGDDDTEQANKDDDADNDHDADEADPDAEDQTDADPQGVVVRMVFPGSPADEAGIVAGNRIVRINDEPVADVRAALAAMNNAAPDSELAVRVIQGADSRDLKIVAGRLPTAIPDELPPASSEDRPNGGENAEQKKAAAAPAEKAVDAKAAPANDAAEAKDAGATRELKLAEFPQECRVYVPAAHADGRPHGVVLWLHAPGEADRDAIIRSWQPICDRDGLLLVVPTAAKDNRWERTELEYLDRLVRRVIGQYHADPQRIVIAGREGGGAMAWWLALASRDVFRGVATIAAPLPRQIRIPDNEPSLRLAVFTGLPADDAAAAQIAPRLRKLSDAGYPVTTITVADRSGELSNAEREKLARWIDALDRF